MDVGNNSEEINVLTNQIEDLNLEINFFLEKFLKFRQKYNVTDKNLNTNFAKIVEAIEEFLSNDPKDIPTTDKTLCNINLAENKLERTIICKLCEDIVPERGRTIRRHIVSPKHKSAMNLVGEGNVNGVRYLMESRAHAVDKQDNIHKALKEQERLAREDMIQMRKAKKEKRKMEKNDEEKRKESQHLPKRVKTFVMKNCAQFIDDGVKTANKLREMPSYNEIRNSLQKTIQTVYPDVKISYFGSRVCGLGTPDSDLDVFVNIGNVYNVYNEANINITNKLDKVRDLLKLQPGEWKNFQSIKNARVPILRVLNIKNQIDCDLSFSNGLGDCNTQLIKHLFTILPLGQKLSIYIKKWFHLTALDIFSTYSVVLMIIFYLQIKKLLPPLKNFQTSVEPLQIGPWQGNFVPRKLKDFRLETVTDDFKTFLYHLKSFFTYYGTVFDFDTYVVCPLLGEPIDKSLFNSSKDKLGRYYNYFKQNPKENGFQIDRVMCIQDPLEQNHNIAKAVPLGTLNLLRHYCRLTAELLDNNDKPSTSEVNSDQSKN